MARPTLAMFALLATGCQSIFGLGDYELAGNGGSGSASSGGSGGGGGDAVTSTGTSDTVSAVTTGNGGNGNCCVGIVGPELVEVKRTAPLATDDCGPTAKIRFGAAQAPTAECTGCSCSNQSGSCVINGIDGDLCFGGITNLDRKTSACTDLGNAYASVASLGPALSVSCNAGTSTLTPFQWRDRFAMCPLVGAPEGCEMGEACPTPQGGYTACLLYPSEQSTCPAGFTNRTNIYDVSTIGCACECDRSCNVSGGNGDCNTSIGVCATAGSYTHLRVDGPCNPRDKVNGEVAAQTLCCATSP